MALPGEGVTITFREVYDQIVQMRGDVRSLTENSSDVAGMLTDHESRLRSIERWRWGIPSLATIAAVGATVAAFVIH